jgi:hypothetical protein
MTFSTMQSFATLLQLGDDHMARDHTILEIIDSYIHLRVNLGRGVYSTSITAIKVNDGINHNIFMERRGTLVTFLLNNMYRSTISINETFNPSTSVYLDISTIILGASINNMSDTARNNLIGCIYRVNIDGHDLPTNGYRDGFRARPSDGIPLLPCGFDPPPPSILDIITRLYVMFALAIIGVIITTILFVTFCKTTHYIFVQRRQKTLPISEQPSERDQSHGDQPVMRFTRSGLLSTNSFEPIEVRTPEMPSNRGNNQISPPTPESPTSSLQHDSVFGTINGPLVPPSQSSDTLGPLEAHTSTTNIPQTDPMTGMVIHPKRTSRISLQSELNLKDDEIKSYIQKRLECANYILMDMNYDEPKVLQDEGEFEPLDSIDKLHTLLLQDIEVTSPKDFPLSPVRPSPLLQSRQWYSPTAKRKPINVPPPVMKKPNKEKRALSALNTTSDNINQKSAAIRREMKSQTELKQQNSSKSPNKRVMPLSNHEVQQRTTAV